jgi:hypothetical protein
LPPTTEETPPVSPTQDVPNPGGANSFTPVPVGPPPCRTPHLC